MELANLEGVLLPVSFTVSLVQTLSQLSLPVVWVARALRWIWQHLEVASALPLAFTLDSPVPSCHLALTGQPLSELLH